jgi:hypothetical protein
MLYIDDDIDALRIRNAYNDKPQGFLFENKHRMAQIIRRKGIKRYKSHCRVNKIR